MSAGETSIAVRVVRRRPLAADIDEFVLARPDGRALPGFEPGAHIDVETPGAHRRSYSLCTGGAEAPDEYVIAVDRRHDGEGGSVSMHRDATTGSALRVSAPSPAFTAHAGTDEAVLIAGGIGVTAVRGLLHDLTATGRAVTMAYLVRERDRAAYLDEMTAAGAAVHIASENAGRRFDLWPLLEDPRGRELYCCGPAGLMRSVRALTMHWRASRLHFEDFLGVSAVDPFGGPFTAQWALTGESIAVDASASLLESLTAAGVSVPSSCRSGTCGTCRLRLLKGTPQHRDVVLTDEERRGQIITCVSRAEGTVRLAPL